MQLFQLTHCWKCLRHAIFNPTKHSVYAMQHGIHVDQIFIVWQRRDVRTSKVNPRRQNRNKIFYRVKCIINHVYPWNCQNKKELYGHRHRLPKQLKVLRFCIPILLFALRMYH
jgi:hypothetical protein